MTITAALDVQPVKNYYHQLAVALGQGLERTIRMEAAATVRSAIKIHGVRPTSKEQIKATSLRKFAGKFYDGGGIGGSINSSQKKGEVGQAWLVRYATAKPVTLYRMSWNGSGAIPAPIDHQGSGFRVTDAEWSKWKSALKRGIEYAKKLEKDRIAARGLTQKSWYELLLKIANGEPVDAPSAIMRARPVKGGSRDVAATVPMKTGTSFSLSVVNDSGIAVKTRGQKALNSAIARRREFFRRSLEAGFFSDAKFVSRNYKWASVTQT